MDREQIALIVTLIGASVILFIVSIIWWINRKTNCRRMPEKSNKAGISTALGFSAFLIFSIWLLRFAVGYYAIVVADPKTQHLASWEEIINSLFVTLRTFSMEEEYAEYIINVKSLIANIIPLDHWSFEPARSLAVIYASALNLLAPIIGGAIILEILSSIFPKFRLKCSYLKFRRTKYFFSELNAESLALAKSIYYEKKAEKPVLIFTDTYIDDEKEKDYELLLEAKQYGAICVRDDLEHVTKPIFSKREFYLMDANEFGNLQTLMGLTTENNVRYLRKANIYLFVQSDAYVQIEKQINKKLDGYSAVDKKKRPLLKSEHRPTIIPIRSYRNLVHNLFVDVPLYEPLINKKDNKKLNVTILGNGVIGTEAFLSAYWFGQMLISGEENGQKTMSDCELTINVVSKDTKEVFWSKIDYINSEIKETVTLCETCDNKSKHLEWDTKGHTNNPYCSVRYIESDVKMDGFWDSSSPEIQKFLNSDYFIVALGNDADNISVADKLGRLIGKRHLEESMDAATGNVIIAYAVFNPELASTLNNQNHYQCRTKGQTDIYMYAFGSLEQVYSCDNIYMSKNKLLAEGTGAAYDKAQMRQKHIEANKTRKNNENKNYSYWADLARAMHIKYKVFSLGWIEKSIFDYKPDKFEDYKSYIEGRCSLYKQVALEILTDSTCDKSKELYNDIKLKQHALAWLEHRRWVAFTRTMGYQYTGEIKRNLALNGENHKNMELKLHPCLIEAKKPELDGDNSYLQDKLQKLFVAPSDEFKVEELDKDKMIALLNKQKEYLVARDAVSSEINKEELDLLDKLTYEWCEEATRVSIINIDKEIEVLKNSSAPVTKETRKAFSKAYGGIYCYDFKMYDYYTSDYDKE